ncbi:hypothetical protein C8A01DRAFT_41159 [Parachaetomium inaequale]|uniref:Uncharacterized protein n=1 Tax=Parachaetomium inaequale TaxID=2588326 RepID=A0AAN6SM49_9PEZI|nr:hypothetical protein C8A01DRAFT_41159 [Parachaetomium inaequale]
MLPSLLVAPLLAVVALAVPSPDLEDRAVQPCTLKTTTAVKYRKCASTSCTAVGQYAKGANVKVSCVKAGQSVNGETAWVKNPSGYYVSAAYLTPNLDKCGSQYLC